MGWLRAKNIGYNSDIAESVHWIDRFGNSIGVTKERRTFQELTVIKQILQNIENSQDIDSVKLGILINHIYTQLIFCRYLNFKYQKEDEYHLKVLALFKELKSDLVSRGAKIRYNRYEQKGLRKFIFNQLFSKLI
jgi:hypothetical protein